MLSIRNERPPQKITLLHLPKDIQFIIAAEVLNATEKCSSLVPLVFTCQYMKDVVVESVIDFRKIRACYKGEFDDHINNDKSSSLVRYNAKLAKEQFDAFSKDHNQAIDVIEMQNAKDGHLAKQALLKALNNNSFTFLPKGGYISAATNVNRAFDLIPAIGQPAEDFVIRHLHDFSHRNLISIVKKTDHQHIEATQEAAKQALSKVLNNDTFKLSIYSMSTNIRQALDLVPVLGKPAAGFVTRHMHQLEHNELISIVEKPGHAFFDVARQALSEILNNDIFTFNSSHYYTSHGHNYQGAHVKKVFDLVPVLGKSAEDFVIRHLHQLDQRELVSIVKKPDHQFFAAAKQALAKRLSEDTFRANGIKYLDVKQALDLVSILGQPAENFVVKHIDILDHTDLISIVYKPDHQLFETAKQVLLKVLNDDTFDKTGFCGTNVRRAFNLITVLGKPAEDFVL